MKSPSPLINPLQSPGVCIYEEGIGYLCNPIQGFLPPKGPSNFVPAKKCFITVNDLQLYTTTLGGDEMFCASDEYIPIYKYPIQNTPPTIIILGDNPAEVIINEVYNDAGALAFDTEDGEITENIITYNPVDTSIIGEYTVVYSVKDSNELIVNVQRIVNVVQNS